MKNNNLQNITQNTKDQATLTPQNSGDELRCSEGNFLMKFRSQIENQVSD